VKRLVLAAVLVAAVPLLAGCPGEDKPPPPPPQPGAVIKVEPNPGNDAQEIVTVRYPNGETMQPRLAKGLCAPGDLYPECAEG
jgi:hypothetical protein